MNETLQDKINRLGNELNDINAKGSFSQDDIDHKNQLSDQIDALEHEKKLQQASEEEREQKFVEHVDSLQQQIQDMDLLGAILPEAQLSGTNIGFTEWNDMRQSLNQILHAWATDIQKATHEAHNEEVKALQTELRSAKSDNTGLQEQVVQLQRQNDALQKDVTETLAELDLEKNEREISEGQLRKLGESYQRHNAKVAQLNQEVEGLQRQLEEAQKPKASTQPSTSVQEQLEGLRKKSQESWAEKANRGLARFELPPLSAPELPAVTPLTEEVAQHGSTFPAAESQDHQLPAPQVVESIEHSFREEDPVHSGQREVDGDTAETEVIRQITALREEQQALQTRMSKVEKELGIGIAV